MYFIFQQSSRSLQEFSFGPHEFGRLEGVKKKNLSVKFIRQLSTF